MDKFFQYVLIALSIVGLLACVFFVITALIGKGADPSPIVCIPAAIGCLFEAALCWVLARALHYLSLRLNTDEE
jgi:lipoprotein